MVRERTRRPHSRRSWRAKAPFTRRVLLIGSTRTDGQKMRSTASAFGATRWHGPRTLQRATGTRRGRTRA
eukprot:2155839-Rhodomonas_salina.1